MPLGKTRNDDLVRIELSTPGEWIEVKRALGVADDRSRQAIALRGQKMAAGNEISDLDLGPLFEAAPFATMEVAIKRWSIADPTMGRTADLTPANIHALSNEDVAIINARLTELYPAPRSADEAKNSSGDTPLPASGEELSLTSSAG